MTHPASLQLDLNRVAVFLRVVEEGGFTAASRVLSLPKSSVSRSVALLEEELKTRLLRRTSRKVSLTEAGALFYERARRGISLLTEAREAVVDLGQELRGPIRVTTATDIALWKLAPLVSSFVAMHKAVSVDVVLTGRVVSLLEEGFDFGLRAGVLRDENLVARRLAPSQFALYAAPSYLAEHGQPRRVKDLADHRCVLFRAPRGRATWTLFGPPRASQTKPSQESVDVQGRVQVDDFTFSMQVIAAGAGIGFLPSFIVESGTNKLVRVLPRYSAPGADLHLVYPAERYMPQRCSAFRDHVLQSDYKPRNPGKLSAKHPH